MERMGSGERVVSYREGMVKMHWMWRRGPLCRPVPERVFHAGKLDTCHYSVEEVQCVSIVESWAN